MGLEKPTLREIWLKARILAAISNEEMDEIRRKIGMSFQGRWWPFGSMGTVGGTECCVKALREHTKLEDSD